MSPGSVGPAPGGRDVADLRLVPAALAAWGTAAAAVVLPVPLGLGAAGALAGLSLLVACSGARRRGSSVRAAVALVLLVAAVVAATTSLRVAERSGGLLADLARRSAVVEVRGRVASEPAAVRARAGEDDGAASAGGAPSPRAVDGPARWVVRVAPDQVVGRGVVGRARGPVLVVGGGDVGALGRDQRVRLVGRLQPARAGDDVVAVLRLQGGVRSVDPAEGWRGRAASLRQGLHAALGGRGEDARGLLPGLVVGDTSAMPPELHEAMRTTGLAHLTAVSGGNTAVLVAAVAAGAALLGARRRVRAAVALTALVAFVGVAGAEPSVLRAGLMAAAALVGVVAARPRRGVPPLAAVVVVLVVADPWASRSAGFALSVLGTGALLLLSGPWSAALARVLPPRAALAVAVPAAAQVVCAPVLLLLSPGVSVAAVPANLLAAPAVAPATVLGVAALVTAPVSVTAAAVLAVPAAWAVDWVALVARTGSGVPGASLPWPEGWGGAALLCGLTVAALVLVPAVASLLRGRAAARRRERRRPPQRDPRRRRPLPAARRRRHRAVALAAAAVLVLAGGALVLGRPGGRGGAWPPPDWVAVQCDVGQGAALVVRSGPGAAVVVDAGPDPGAVDGCLDRLDVEEVDLLVLTHFHADHVDGLAGVLDGREVARAVVSPLAVPAPAAERVAALLRDAGVPVGTGEAGLSGTAGDATWRVLAPADGRYTGRPAAGGASTGGASTGGAPTGGASTGGASTGGGEDDGANDASVVVHLETAGVRLAVLGDLGAEAQGELRRATAADPGAWPVDVLGVAHHGSADQDPGLAALAAPRVGLVGVGENTYGHPSPSAVDLYAGGGALVACTTATGDVAVAGAPDALVLVPRRRTGPTC
ncbi:ComEC/Rec2 family competence protein [Pseudokineococcus basanitobsidens]|uniref:ComEC/Rec2 family competence protein n=1 Tax=Pseudokineococcus basanitobsidens TaxID=1926649 RepID=A0ABU8RL29_9ACTN